MLFSRDSKLAKEKNAWAFILLLTSIRLWIWLWMLKTLWASCYLFHNFNFNSTIIPQRSVTFINSFQSENTGYTVDSSTSIGARSVSKTYLWYFLRQPVASVFWENVTTASCWRASWYTFYRSKYKYDITSKIKMWHWVKENKNKIKKKKGNGWSLSVER